MTNHALVKRKSLLTLMGGRLQLQRPINTMAHHGNGNLQQLSVDKATAQMREEMMEDMGIPDNIQEAIVDNHEPNADGTDIAMRRSWFQNGHL